MLSFLRSVGLFQFVQSQNGRELVDVGCLGIKKISEWRSLSYDNDYLPVIPVLQIIWFSLLRSYEQ